MANKARSAGCFSERGVSTSQSFKLMFAAVALSVVTTPEGRQTSEVAEECQCRFSWHSQWCLPGAGSQFGCPAAACDTNNQTWCRVVDPTYCTDVHEDGGENWVYCTNLTAVHIPSSDTSDAVGYDEDVDGEFRNSYSNFDYEFDNSYDTWGAPRPRLGRATA